MKKIVGIIGGMGPLATIDLFQKIVNLTPVKRDQDHLRIIIDNNPGIPDRTESILNKNKRPLPYLVKSAKKLEKMGVDIIAIPCNTAHYFYDDLQNEIKVPIINMIDEVVDTVSSELKKLPKKIGLLATDGTIRSGIYQGPLNNADIKIIVPNKLLQKKVMNLIYGKKGIKRNSIITKEVQNEFRKIISWLTKKGARAIIIGCTDISSAVNPKRFSVPIIDSNLVLAKTVIRRIVSPLQMGSHSFH
ncbi:MAG: amino acid racemase [Elusimicrobia bacterium]|nr:amino acid racemase [Elusimicrobiota bacterium]